MLDQPAVNERPVKHVPAVRQWQALHLFADLEIQQPQTSKGKQIFSKLFANLKRPICVQPSSGCTITCDAISRQICKICRVIHCKTECNCTVSVSSNTDVKFE
uniref:Uncharacterized protein n=1 Tax=Arundo donax TaxID=35708 RepID=A0A0A9CRK4_ARUDO